MTNRKLAGEDFWGRLQRVAQAGVSGIILREKDLDEAAYEELAAKAKTICRDAQVPLILHTDTEAARRLEIRRIHMPFPVFQALTEQEKKSFDLIGVSTHSAAEAKAAWEAGASYITAGHIFATDCKRGLAPRGIPFLEEVCRTVEIPVYAIGGIGPENVAACMEAGAAGVCLMSSLMKAENPKKLLNEIRRCVTYGNFRLL